MIDIESVLVANNYTEYLKGFNLTELFGKLWSKFAEVINKSYKKVFEDGKEGKESRWSGRINELRRKYPIVFYEFSLVPN